MDWLDNGPNWKETPPKYRKLIMLLGVLSIIAIFFVIIFKNYTMSQWFSYCFMMWITGVLSAFGIYTWSRGQMDKSGNAQPPLLETLIKELSKGKEEQK